MSRLPPIPDPLDCVLFDAGDTLLAPAPSFQGRFVAVAADQGLPLEEAAVDAAVADAVRAAAWPDDWTDPATQREFWMGFYQDVLATLGHAKDGLELAEALFASFSDPASYQLFDDVRPALDELAGRGITLGRGVQLRALAGRHPRPPGGRPPVRDGGHLGRARGGQARPADLRGRPCRGRGRPLGDRARRRPAGQRRGRGPGGRHHPGPDRPLRPLPGARRRPPGRGPRGPGAARECQRPGNGQRSG